MDIFVCISTGLAYAGFSAFTLEAIGKGAAATKYNVFASLSNAPIYLITFVDEWAHEKWNSFGMLNAEAILRVYRNDRIHYNFSISKQNKEEVIFERIKWRLTLLNLHRVAYK